MIALGCDHGGFALKQEIMKHLDEKQIAYKDYGTYTEESCDYPIYGEAVGKAVASGECERGIIICGTGIGISMAANKVGGIRCAHCADTVEARLTREHNDANMLAIGAGFTGELLALEMVDVFLTTPFSEGERHARRVGKVNAIRP